MPTLTKFLGRNGQKAPTQINDAECTKCQPASLQMFALATSAPVDCPAPKCPLMSLPVTLSSDSLVSITFAAMGVDTHDTMTPINCDVDGNPCAPDGSGVLFQYPTVCCDTRSFTWIAMVSKGTHTVNISFGAVGSAALTESTVFNRTLLVQAAPI